MSNPTHGQKVTDPNAPEIREGTGAVASDSLAAESKAFSSNKGAPLSVAGANSTFATTDTSGADTLAPTTSASARPDNETYNPLDAKKSSAQGAPQAEKAPTYINNQLANDGVAKGGAGEGDFSHGLKNASFGTDIGGRNDPGRLATQKFSTDASKTSVGLASVPKQEGDLAENPYEALGREANA